jgi:hypothetical protein
MALATASSGLAPAEAGLLESPPEDEGGLSEDSLPQPLKLSNRHNKPSDFRFIHSTFQVVIIKRTYR